MKKFSSFAFGMFMGAWLCGVGVLLFTPMSGNDMRERIKKESQKIADDVKAASEYRQKELIEELDNLRHGKAIKLETRE